jgi:hypothetical protein
MVKELLESHWLMYGNFNIMYIQKNKEGVAGTRMPHEEKNI